MVGGYGQDDRLALSTLLGDFDPDLGMGSLDFSVYGLPDIMEKTGAGRGFHIGSDLRGHLSCVGGNLPRVFQDVLPVGCAVAQTSQQLDQFTMNVLETELEGRGLSVLHESLFKLLTGLFDDLFDSGRVDSPVLHEGLEGTAGDLPLDGIRGGDDHRFGGVVDDQVRAGQHLQGPNVPSLPSDDPPLHLVGRKVDDGDCRFDHILGGTALNSGGHDLSGQQVLPFLVILLHLPEKLGHIGLAVLFDFLKDYLSRLLGGEAGDSLQLAFLLKDDLLLLLLQLIYLSLLRLDLLLGLVEVPLPVLQVHGLLV